MTAFFDSTIPRHAAVLPSFVARMVRKKIRHSAGQIAGHELLAWIGPLHSERRAAEFHEIFVDGRRNGFADIWNHPVGVRLTVELEPEAFTSLSLREVKMR